jgi:aminopeptidase N
MRLGICTLVLALALPCSAQESKHLIDYLALDPAYSDAIRPTVHDIAGMALMPSKPLKDDIQAVSYDIWLDLTSVLNPDTTVIVPRQVPGTMTGRFILGQTTTSTFTLHAHRTFIPSVITITVNGIPADTTRGDGDLLTLPVPPGLGPGDTVDVMANYMVQRTSYDVGLNVIGGRGVAQVQAPHPIAYTFAQPEGARRWFVCNDVPSDKALFTIALTIPAGYTMAANGVESGTIDLPDGKKRVTWTSPAQIPTYLVAFAVSRFRLYEQVATSLDGRRIPIRNYHWEVDHDGLQYNAVNALRNIPAMFPAMEEVFGPYPYSTYGHMTVYPIRFGGMEHTTMSTISRAWLEGTAEEGYAHELGHQWLGDMITCATWGDIWLNEGGATYSEAIWRGARDGNQGFIDRMEQRRQAYLRQGLAAPPVWDIPFSIMFNEATTYAKSAWVYHMIERNMGAEDFKRFISWWTTQAGGAERAAQSQEFIEGAQTIDPNPLIPWEQFFRQWVVERGHPVFSSMVKARETTEGSIAEVTITQTQQADGVPDVFHVVMPIRFSSGRAVVDTSIVMTTRSASMTVSLPFVPTEVVVDPTASILCEKSETLVTSVHSDVVPLSQRLAATDAAGILWVSVGGTDVGTLVVSDVLGATVASEFVYGDQRTIPFAVANLPAGTYFVSYISPSTSQSIPWLHLR